MQDTKLHQQVDAGDETARPVLVAFHDKKWRFRAYAVWNVLVALFVVVLLVVSAATSERALGPAFWNNLLIIALLIPPTVMLMAGGGLDLSVGALIGLLTIFFAQLVNNNTPAIVAILIVLLVALLVGVFNALVIGLSRLNGIIVTLAVAVLLQGIAITISSNFQTVDIPLFEGPGFRIVAWIIVVLVAIAAILLMQRTPFGRRPLSGSFDETESFWMRALYIGGPYILSSLMGGLAAIVFISWTRIGTPEIGANIQSDVILAVLIGGSMLGGGFGSVFGGLLGAVAVSLLTIMQLWLQLSADISGLVFKGIFFVLAVLLSGLFHFLARRLYQRAGAQVEANDEG